MHQHGIVNVQIVQSICKGQFERGVQGVIYGLHNMGIYKLKGTFGNQKKWK